MNPYYTFNDEQQEILFSRHDTPSPWINYLSNGRLHAFVSQAGGGLCWWQSPAIFRFTRYRMYNLPTDTPGFYVYIRHDDGTYWCPTSSPCETPLDEWNSRHAPGRTQFTAQKKGITANQSLFVAPDCDALIWDLYLRNTTDSAHHLDVFGYCEFSLHEWLREVSYGCYNKHQLAVRYDAGADALVYLYHADNLPNHAEAPLVFFSAAAPIDTWCGDRDAFCGCYRSERNPRAAEDGCCPNRELEGGEPCGALHKHLFLNPGGDIRMQFFLGCVSGALVDYPKARTHMVDMLGLLRKEQYIDEQREKLDAWWQHHLNRFSCSLPDETAQRTISLWNPVQCVHTGRYSRSISFYASGLRGVGFRDTCQDMLAIAYRKPAWAREKFLYLTGRQVADGHVAHQSWPVEGAAPQMSIHSDDHLWLPLLAFAIAAETGNTDFLHQPVSFLGLPGQSSDESAPVWEHLLRAVTFTEQHLGTHTIPLTLASDWNDIIGKFAKKGRGESVFAGQQYVYALNLLIELAEFLCDTAAVERLTDCRTRQIQALEACAWDGAWWRRGFDDDGNPVGSESASWGKLFLNPQSWAVLAGIGTPEQRRQAMEQVAEQCTTGIGLKILTPGFDTYPETTDPFSGYNKGCGENGAIFCHANTWAIIAEALLGNGNRAWDYYSQLIPHNALRKAGIERYRAEPYAYVSNILGPENVNFGYANVSQVSGTAAWMDIAATQYILGIRPTLTGLLVDPCIPSAWDGFTVERVCRDCRFMISVANPNHREHGVQRLSVEGADIPVNAGKACIPFHLCAGKEQLSVEVTMG